MAAQTYPHVVAAQFLAHIEIIEHGTVHRVVVYEYASFLAFFLLKSSQPDQVAARGKGRGHSHIRPARASQEAPSSCAEVELFVAEGLHHAVAAALGPGCVVVARNGIVGHLQCVEQFLREGQFLVRTEVGDISGADHEIRPGVLVHIPYAELQVLRRLPLHRYMRVCQPGETQFLCLQRRRRQQQCTYYI